MAGAGAEGAPKSCTAEGAAEVSSKADAEAAPGCSEAKAVVAAPPLPRAKNMMRAERVEYILNWKHEPFPRTGKIDPIADMCDEEDKEMAEYQEEIRKELEEKGYVSVPDGYEEDRIDRCNTAAFNAAYLKVFGCLPPEDDG